MNQPSDLPERNGIKTAHAGKPFTSEDVVSFQDPGLYEDAIRKLVKEHGLAVEKLTEDQFVECLRQAIACGDFVKYVANTYDYGTVSQQIVYIPFREREQLLARIKDLEDEKEPLNDELNGEM